MATVTEQLDNGRSDTHAALPFLRRVRIRGYKSIAFCDVTLEPLTVLVGRNASGKSNFLDALAFLRDALAINIGEATKLHGGWQSLHSRSSPEKTIEIEAEVGISPLPSVPGEVQSPRASSVTYGFMLQQPPFEAPPVFIREWFRESGSGNEAASFELNGTPDPKRTSMQYT